MAIRAEQGQICNLSPAMVTSANKWKILKCDEKLQRKKETNKQKWCQRYITKIRFHILIIRLFAQRVMFSFYTTWLHSKKVVQEGVLLIVTYVNNKAFLLEQIQTKCTVEKFSKM